MFFFSDGKDHSRTYKRDLTLNKDAEFNKNMFSTKLGATSVYKFIMIIKLPMLPMRKHQVYPRVGDWNQSINKFLEIPIIQNENTSSLRSFVDNLRHIVRTLMTLKQICDQQLICSRLLQNCLRKLLQGGARESQTCSRRNLTLLIWMSGWKP